MSAQTVTFEAPSKAIAVVDQLAADREVERAEILRDALAFYLADQEALKADLEQADREIEAGESIPHEDVMAWLEAQHKHSKDAKAA